MDKFDVAFDKQTRFSFSQQRSTAKKQTAAAQRTSWSAVLDLDHNVGPHGVSTTDFRDLSRYIMEDMMRVMVGAGFLVCVAKGADFGGKQKQTAADQRKANVAGDYVRISRKVYINLAGTISLANPNEAICLGMTRGQFMTEYFNDSGGFRFSFEGSLEKMRFSWQGVSTRSDDVMFFGQKFTGGGVRTMSC